MALINRISRLFKADFHAVLDNLEDPESLLKQSIREMEDAISQLRLQVTQAEEIKQDIESRIHKLELQSQARNNELDICFESGNDELAKSIIKKILESKALDTRLRENLACEKKRFDTLNSRLEEYSEQLDSLQQKSEIVGKTKKTRDSQSGSEYAARGENNSDWLVSSSAVEIAFLEEKQKRLSARENQA